MTLFRGTYLVMSSCLDKIELAETSPTQLFVKSEGIAGRRSWCVRGSLRLIKPVIPAYLISHPAKCFLLRFSPIHHTSDRDDVSIGPSWKIHHYALPQDNNTHSRIRIGSPVWENYMPPEKRQRTVPCEKCRGE